MKIYEPSIKATVNPSYLILNIPSRPLGVPGGFRTIHYKGVASFYVGYSYWSDTAASSSCSSWYTRWLIEIYFPVYNLSLPSCLFVFLPAYLSAYLLICLLIYIVSIRHPMRRIPICIASDGLALFKKRVGQPPVEPYSFLGNARSSRPICIGISRVGCFMFILYNIFVD